MSISANSLAKVADWAQRMQALRAIFQQTQLAIGDNPDAVLDQATITQLKQNLQVKYDQLAVQLKAEVSANW